MNYLNEAEQKEREFHLRCGEILRLGVATEGHLVFLISKYFGSDNRKECLIRDSILLDMSFERQIEIFKEICRSEGINKEKLDKTVESIKFVQRLRNQVAHAESFMDDLSEGIKLQSCKSVKKKEDITCLSDSKMKEIREKQRAASEGIFDIYKDLMEENKVQKIKFFG